MPTSSPPDAGRHPARGQGEAAAGRSAEGHDPAHAAAAAARIVIDVPGRTSRTMPAIGVSSGSTMSPVATRQRPFQGNSNSPPIVPRGPDGRSSSPRSARSGASARRGRGWSRSLITLSSSRASRSRSAIGAPTTTEEPASTSVRSPGHTAKTVSTGRLDQPARGDEDEIVERRSATRIPPAHARSASASSSSRRRSARSGRRSGTSRRSTSPARPPATSTAK